MLNKFLSKPIFRHAITIAIAGAVCYFAYREYSKMIQRLEIIANELYKAKQEIISLKKQQNSKKQTKNIRNPYKTKDTKKKQLLSKKNIPTPPKVNPIKVNKQSSMERISKHLPTKSQQSQQLQTIIENAHQEFTLTEDAKIIDVNTIDDNEEKEVITYDSDSDLITDSETDLIDSDIDDDLLSANSEIIDSIGNELQEELNAEIGDLDLEAELNTEIGQYTTIENNEQQSLKEEIEKLAEVVQNEIIDQDITIKQEIPNIIISDESEPQSANDEQSIKNEQTVKVFGIDTNTIKEQKLTPKQTPKKRKGRKGLVTSWTAFMKDEEIEKKILIDYPNADFGQVSKIKGQIWRTYTNEQKNVYKQKAKELTKLNRQQLS